MMELPRFVTRASNALYKKHNIGTLRTSSLRKVSKRQFADALVSHGLEYWLSSGQDVKLIESDVQGWLDSYTNTIQLINIRFAKVGEELLLPFNGEHDTSYYRNMYDLKDHIEKTVSKKWGDDDMSLENPVFFNWLIKNQHPKLWEHWCMEGFTVDYAPVLQVIDKNLRRFDLENVRLTSYTN